MRPGAATAIHPTRLETHPLGRNDLRWRIAHMEYLTRCDLVMAYDRPKETVLRVPFVHLQCCHTSPFFASQPQWHT